MAEQFRHGSISGSVDQGFKPRALRYFLSITRNFTPRCLPSARCINGYRRHTVGR